MSGEVTQPLDTLLWLFVAVSIGCVYRYGFNRFKLYVPYSIALLLTGVLLGLIELQSTDPNNAFTESQSVLAHIEPNLLLLIFIPPLLFASAFNIRFHVIWNSLWSSVLLAFPGVGIITVILAVSAQYMFTDYNWSWPFCFLFASILGSTDPVAVVSILRDVGAPQILSTIIEGESLLNDGSSYVLFLIFTDLVTGSTSGAGNSVALFFQIALGGPAFGYAFGVCMIWFLQHVYNDIETEITTTIVGAYFVFYIADAYLNVSSYLAVVTMALYMAKYKHCISPEVHKSLKHTWQVIAFIAETLIFLLSGVIVSERIFKAGSVTPIDVGYLFLTWALLQISRAIAVVLVTPLMQLSDIKLTWREQLAITWSGLRGAVALVLALLTYLTPGIPSEDSNRVIFLVGGNVFLTLILNGTSVRWLVTKLKLHIPSTGSQLVLEQAITYMRNKCNDKLNEIKALKYYESIDYTLVEQYLPSQIIDKLQRQSSQLASERCNSHDHDNNHDHSHDHEPIDQTAIQIDTSNNKTTKRSVADLQLIKEELSRRFLSAMLADFYAQHSRGLISRDVLSMLIEANEAASDTGELSTQWDRISAQFQLPLYLRILYINDFLRRFDRGKRWITKYVFIHLCRSIELSTALLKSKRRISQLLDEYPELSDIDRDVINQVKVEAGSYQRKAFKAWLDVQQSYPQAFEAIQTRNATKIVLHYARHEARKLRDTAMLEATEFSVLKHAIEEQLFRLERKQLNINLPSSDSILRDLPFINALPEKQRDRLLKRGKLRFLQHGETLFERNQRSAGMYIIVRGIVTVRYQVDHFKDQMTTFNNNTFNSTARTLKQHFETDDNGAVHTFRYSDGSAKRVRKEKLGVGSVIGAYDSLTSTGTLSSARAQTFVQLYYFRREVLLELVAANCLGDSLFRLMAESLFKSKFYDYMRRKNMSFMHAAALADRAKCTALTDGQTISLEANQHVLVLTGALSRSKIMQLRPGKHTQAEVSASNATSIDSSPSTEPEQQQHQHDRAIDHSPTVATDTITANERTANISAARTTEVTVPHNSNSVVVFDDVEHGSSTVTSADLVQAPCLIHCSQQYHVSYTAVRQTRILTWTDADEQAVSKIKVDHIPTLDEEAEKYGYNLTLMETWYKSEEDKLKYKDDANWIRDGDSQSVQNTVNEKVNTRTHPPRGASRKPSRSKPVMPPRHPTALELRLQHRVDTQQIGSSVRSLPAKFNKTFRGKTHYSQPSSKAPKLQTLPDDMFDHPAEDEQNDA